MQFILLNVESWLWVPILHSRIILHKFDQNTELPDRNFIFH